MKRLHQLISLLLLLLLLVSCSTIKFPESDLKWSNTFKTGSMDLFLINDSIIYGNKYNETYLLDSCTGKILSLIPNEEIISHYPIYGEYKYDESFDVKWNRSITRIKIPCNFDYNVVKIDHNEIFRGQINNKADLIVTRKSDNKKKKIKFKRSIFDGVYEVIPYGKNKLLIEYAVYYNEAVTKIGMIDLDKLFVPRSRRFAIGVQIKRQKNEI